MSPAIVHRQDPDSAQRSVVTPLVRALALFGAFTPQDRWLGNSQLAQRTRLAPSTVTRIAQTLVQLGYLLHDATERKYRLAATVLDLGYAAIAHSDIQRVAGAPMREFAEKHDVHVSLATRDRLELVVIESQHSSGLTPALRLPVGMRVGIAHSPMGWSLLAALPELERHYLQENIEHRKPRDWAGLRRRLNEGLAQVDNKGYCSAVGEWDPDLGILATPVITDDAPPFVLSCIGHSSKMSRARIERELGPRLQALARGIQDAVHQAQPHSDRRGRKPESHE